jgi:N-acetyl-alpha-D-muramate 1-phosphate uridylyltransferase
MQMVIPCGGLATRLGEIAKKTPKAMLDINGKPFFEHQIEIVKKYDIDELILCVGHLGEKIEQYFGNGVNFGYGIKIKYSYDEGLGVIGSIKNAEDLLQKHFFMMYGDSYLPKFDFGDMYYRFLNQDKLVMLSVWQNNNELDPSNLKVNVKHVTGAYVEKADYIDYGVAIFDKEALKCIPAKKPYSTKELWTKLIKKNQLAAYEVYERFYDIGTPERLDEVRALLKQQ